VIGPVVGRYAIDNGDNWKYVYWGGFVAQFISLLALAFLYFPPKHPKGTSTLIGGIEEQAYLLSKSLTV
jgi:hypothetical protein